MQLYADLSVVSDSLQAVDKQLLVLRQSHEQQHGEGSGEQQQALRHRSFVCQSHTERDRSHTLTFPCQSHGQSHGHWPIVGLGIRKRVGSIFFGRGGRMNQNLTWPVGVNWPIIY